MTEIHKVEEVADSGEITVARIKVPGGWIYDISHSKLHSYGGGYSTSGGSTDYYDVVTSSSTFVPDASTDQDSVEPLTDS